MAKAKSSAQAATKPLDVRTERGSDGSISVLVRGGAPGEAHTHAKNIASEMKQRAPLGKTGNLRKGITATPEGEHKAQATSQVTYSRYVDEGTKFMKARPFVKPSIAEAKRIKGK